VPRFIARCVFGESQVLFCVGLASEANLRKKVSYNPESDVCLLRAVVRQGEAQCVYIQSVSKFFEVPLPLALEEAFAAAPHDGGGLALGGARRLGVAGEGGKEHGRKGDEELPEACVVYVVCEAGTEGVIAGIYGCFLPPWAGTMDWLAQRWNVGPSIVHSSRPARNSRALSLKGSVSLPFGGGVGAAESGRLSHRFPWRPTSPAPARV